MNVLRLLFLPFLLVASACEAQTIATPIPGGQVRLDINNKPLEDISLESQHWQGVLDPIHVGLSANVVQLNTQGQLPPLDAHLLLNVPGGSGSINPAILGSTLYVSASTGNDAAGGRGTFAPFATLAAAIAKAQPYDHIWMVPGTYSYSGTATIPATLNNVLLDGYGAKIVAQNTPTSIADSHKIDVLADHCVIRGLEIVGSPAGQAYTGSDGTDSGLIQVAGKYTLIEDCWLHDSVSYGVRFGATYDHSCVRNCLIVNTAIGVIANAYNSDVDGLTVEGNTMLDCPYGGYRGELQQGHKVTHEYICDNLVTHIGYLNSLGIELAGDPAASPEACSHQRATVSRNNVSGYGYGISLNSVNIGSVDNNSVYNCDFIGIEFVLSFYLSGDANRVDGTSGCTCFSLDRAQQPANQNAYFTVKNSVITNANKAPGIHVYYAQHSTLENNEIYGTGLPIWSQGSPDATIRYNRIHLDNTNANSPAILVYGRGGTTLSGYYITDNLITHAVTGGNDASSFQIGQDEDGVASYTHLFFANNYSDSTFCGGSFFGYDGRTSLVNPIFSDNVPTNASTQYGFPLNTQPLSGNTLSGLQAIYGAGDGTQQITSHAPFKLPFGTDGNFALSLYAGQGWYNAISFYTYDGFLAGQILYGDPSKGDQGLFDTLAITSRNGGDVLIGTTNAPGPSAPEPTGAKIRVPTGGSTQTSSGIIEETSVRVQGYIALTAMPSAPTGVPGALAWFWCDPNGDVHVHHSNGTDLIISPH